MRCAQIRDNRGQAALDKGSATSRLEIGKCAALRLAMLRIGQGAGAMEQRDSPNHFHSIGTDFRVNTEDRHIFHEALRHQHLIKGVPMMIGQRMDFCRMRQCDREGMELILTHLIQDERGDIP